MSKPAGQELSVKVEDDRLIISIGVGLLAFAVQGSDGWPEEYAVNDVRAFAIDLARELKREEEDGTTPVHRMLDQAAQEALEQGCLSAAEAPVEEGLKLAKESMK